MQVRLYILYMYKTHQAQKAIDSIIIFRIPQLHIEKNIISSKCYCQETNISDFVTLYHTPFCMVEQYIIPYLACYMYLWHQSKCACTCSHYCNHYLLLLMLMLCEPLLQ